jgi:hypothetical protein
VLPIAAQRRCRSSVTEKSITVLFPGTLVGDRRWLGQAATKCREGRRLENLLGENSTGEDVDHFVAMPQDRQ